MKTLNKESKKAAELWERYCSAQFDDIRKAYGKPSPFKVRVWEQARDEMNAANEGRGLRILGAGSSYFSYAFRFKKDGAHWLRCVFPSKSYEFEIINP